MLPHASRETTGLRGFVLLAPYLGYQAPTSRPDSGGWVAANVPRILALNVLHAVGITAWEGLPVLRFALDEQAQANLKPWYSYRWR
jgi:hypothetical protein